MKIGDGGSGAFAGAVFDLDNEGFAAPAVLHDLARIPEAVRRGGEFFEEDDMVKPRDAEKYFRRHG